MSVMFEVYYKEPLDLAKESALAQEIAQFGGLLTNREEPTAEDTSRAVVLTYEFDDWPTAEAAANQVRTLGEHVEGPMEY